MIEMTFVLLSILALILLGIRDPVRVVMFAAFLLLIHINFRG